MDIDSLAPWIRTQQKRGATTLRLKVGGPRSLQSRGTVDLVVDGEPADVDDVVTEVREDLAGNGWPAVAETWGLDALDAEGKVLKSCQDTAKDGPTAGRHTPQVSASRSDWEVTVAALVTLAGQSHELSKVAIAEAGKERAERRQAEADANAAARAQVEAEAAAMVEAALTAAENAETGDDSVKSRGVEVLEKLMSRLDARGKKPSREDVMKMVNDPANRDMLAGLATDPAFLDALAKAAGSPEDVGSEATPP